MNDRPRTMRYAVCGGDGSWSATPEVRTWAEAVQSQERSLAASDRQTGKADMARKLAAMLRADVRSANPTIRAMAKSTGELMLRHAALARPERPLSSLERVERDATLQQAYDGLLWLARHSTEGIQP
jgi:hypothetical protein